MLNLAKFKRNSLRWTFFFLCGFAITMQKIAPLRAQGVDNAPVELKALITQIDSATNRQDLPRVMQFFSPEFTNSDGLTYSTLEQGLTQFWQGYKVVEYNTTLKSWQQEGDKIVAETVTKIKATGESLGRKIKLTTNITSRQHFKNNQLIYQEILSENTQITTGEHPPQVKLNLPEQVRVGQKFDFDVIVEEPLGDNLLAGAVLNERITSDRYLNPGILELDLLSGGGIFKQVTAPQEPNNQWFSAIIVRGDGITLVTQRVKVTQ